MDVSEPILAAIIGAVATLTTAVFQLALAFRSRSKAESKPKRGAVRSLLSVFAIILASAVGGFAYSELRAERAREDIRGLRAELTEQFRALAASSSAHLEQFGMRPAGSGGLITLASAQASAPNGSAESIAQIDVCRSQPPAFGNEPVACAERDADRMALCAIVPAEATVAEVQLFARPLDSTAGWDQSRVAFDQDAGGVRFIEAPFEVAQGAGVKTVCTHVAHWNGERGHAVRLLVLYSSSLHQPTAQAAAAP